MKKKCVIAMGHLIAMYHKILICVQIKISLAESSINTELLRISQPSEENSM